MRQAVRVRGLFEEAGEVVPNVLARMFGENIGSRGDADKRIKYPTIEGPPRPDDVPVDWVWVPLAETLPTTLVMGLLRQAGRPLATKEIIDRVERLRPAGDVNPGSILNIGPRLEGQGIIVRGEGWDLVDKKNAPVIGQDAVWWAVDRWGKPEMAAHRRIVIRHVLNVAGGLQIVQLVNQLQLSGLCKAPVTKDLLKMDMSSMQKAGVVRRNTSRKWVVVEEGGKKQ